MKLPDSLCDFSSCPPGVTTITPGPKLPDVLCPCPSDIKSDIAIQTYNVSNTTNNYDDVLDTILTRKVCKRE